MFAIAAAVSELERYFAKLGALVHAGAGMFTYLRYVTGSLSEITSWSFRFHFRRSFKLKLYRVVCLFLT